MSALTREEIAAIAERSGFGGQLRRTLCVKLELFAKHIIQAYLTKEIQDGKENQ